MIGKMPNENDSEFAALIGLAANQDQEALLCLNLAISYFHKFDDVIDGDIKLTARSLVELNNLLTRLQTCKFYRDYSSILTSHLMLIGEDYVASNEEDSYWNVLRHNGNNFVRIVALLTGGEQLMNEVSKQLRAFSFKNR